MIWRWLFIFYIYLVINTTGVGTLEDILSYPELIRPEEINLIPFQSGGLLLNILNTIMFMPLGFLLPFIWKKYRHIVPAVALGAGFSLLIELLQLFNRRATDIDDLLMNTSGTLLGFAVWKIWQHYFKSPEKDIHSFGTREAQIYVLLSIAGFFFLYHWRFFTNLLY